MFSTWQSEKEESGLEQRPTKQPVINDIVLHVSEVEAVLKSLHPNTRLRDYVRDSGENPEGNRRYYRSITVYVVQQVPGGGLLPRESKLANVVPVYQKDEKYHVENYNLPPLYWFKSP